MTNKLNIINGFALKYNPVLNSYQESLLVRRIVLRAFYLRLFYEYFITARRIGMANPQIENGHLDIANELVEVLAKTQLSGYESRILWAVWRKTYCWHKKSDWISLEQFIQLTDLQESHISRTIKKLIEKKILTKNGKLISFNKNYQNWQVNLPKMVSKLTKNGKKNLPKLGDTKEKPKETFTKEKKENADVLWKSIFLNNPGSVELDFVEYLQTKFNGKTKTILYSLRENNFHSIRKMKDALDEQGNIKPIEMNNGTHTKRSNNFVTAEELKQDIKDLYEGRT